jgi:hypothetical protein
MGGRLWTPDQRRNFRASIAKRRASGPAPRFRCALCDVSEFEAPILALDLSFEGRPTGRAFRVCQRCYKTKGELRTVAA